MLDRTEIQETVGRGDMYDIAEKIAEIYAAEYATTDDAFMTDEGYKDIEDLLIAYFGIETPDA